MSNLKYLLFGAWFGLILIKSEAASWFRIQEMFMFESFHMYGIMVSAIATAMLSLLIIRKLQLKTISGEKPELVAKEFNKGTVIGALLFGCGWALTGACPGPLFVQIGAGYWIVLITFSFALIGTWTYAFFKEKLPH
ncbi:MAG: YeeE/YedE family protein [Calditrichaeota bacterium]|nr:YeeE/YedE family protein [Calditrichota bacterium]